MSYGVNFANLYRRAAGYVDEILKGAKPSDLPIRAADEVRVGDQRRDPKALGLTIPQALLVRADEVIE